MKLPVKDQKQLDDFLKYCEENKYFNVGYPESADFDYKDIEPFLRYSINNCGDWGEYCNYLLNTFDFEKEVMEYFADLFKIPFEKSWGYVTNGGTEGNMFGCYLAREIFPNGTLYYSKDTHYSVAKIVKLLRIKSQVVESQPNGIIDYDDLMKKIKEDKEEHPIIFANVGTTVFGAIDDIAKIQQLLKEAGYKREDYYIHADAALSGMILPFVDQPQAFTFADGIDSIGVSGHKMIGSPIPCGIVVAKKENVDRISVEIDYIAAHDKTITGSRNGHTPLMIWKAIKSHTAADWKARIDTCFANADYVIGRLKEAGIDAWRHKNSITVVLPCPSEAVWKKHCLAPSNGVAHIITTAHHNADRSSFDSLINDVIADHKANTKA